MARLYRPGEAKPFRTQIAGRELLEPAKAPDIKAASVVAEVASAPEAAEDALVFAADSAAPVAHSTEPLIIRGEKTRPIRHDGFIERISNATFPFPSDQPGFFGRTATALRTVCVAVLTGALAAYWIVLFKRASKTRRARTVAANRTGSEADPLSARLSARWSEDIVPLKLKTSDPRAEAVVKGINRRR
jgi:predicted NBD/HSP70 family sugar kinase